MSDFSKRLYAILKNHPSSTLIANLNTRTESYTLGNELILTSVVDTIEPNCYIASPYAMIIIYAQEELTKIPSWLYRNSGWLLIQTFAFILRLARIDHVQTLNNYLLSTNFFSPYWEIRDDLSAITYQARTRHPHHALLLRSLNGVQNPHLIKQLQRIGWTPLVSRQIYLFSQWQTIYHKHNVQMDQKLLSSERFIFVKPPLEDDSAFNAAYSLYNSLYLDKYSIHNVQFTPLYLKQLVEQRLLHLRLLKDTLHDRYVGVIGMMGDGGVITAPIVGYETHSPKKDALYRRIIAYALSYAHQHDYLLNLSSGAAEFKTLRGGEPHLEYMMVYTHHLPLFRKIVWKALSLLSRYFYAPLLQKFHL
jgi:hypothetical protein